MKPIKHPASIVSTLSFLAWVIAVLTPAVSRAQYNIYTDNFSATNDYSQGVVSGTIWDGMQINGGLQVPDANAAIVEANADITTTNALTVSTTDSWWQDADDNGFLLYKNVTGDFTATVFVNVSLVQYDTAGILVRNPDVSSGYENWISILLFPEFNVGADMRSIINDVQSDTQQEASPGSLYLKIQRTGNTFSTYYSYDGTNYTALGTANRSDLPATLQVGLFEGTYATGNIGQAIFKTFTLVEPIVVGNSPTNVVATAGVNQVSVTWNAVAGATNYIVSRATDGATFVPVANTVNTNFTDTNVFSGLTYSYVLQSQNSAGQSADSSVASAMPTSSMPTITDNFSAANDYSQGDVSGTIWDGMQINGGLHQPDANAAIVEADADITTPNALTVSTTDAYWQDNEDNGFLLYKNVTGDFGAIVYLNVDTVQYDTAGIMARNPSTSGGNENWVSTLMFPELGQGADAREVVNGGQIDVANGTPNNTGYLALFRRGNVFTSFYSPDGTNYSLLQSYTRADMPSTVQVGLFEGTYSENVGTVVFTNFSLTAVPIVGNPPTNVVAAAGVNQVSVTWNAVAGATNYIVLRSTDGSGYAEITNLVSTNLTDTNVFYGLKYYYEVLDQNPAGISISSSPASAIPTTLLPAITDNFSVTNDYSQGVVSGTIWDGVLINGGLQMPNPDTAIVEANADITTTNTLTVSSSDGYWQDGEDNGFLLYKNVTGDFGATLYLNVDTVQYDTAGVMARNPDTSGGVENWIAAEIFPEFLVGADQRNVVNSSQTDTSLSTSGTSGFLKLFRTGNVFTTFYSTDGTNYTEISSATRTDLPATLQVGLFEGTYSENVGTVLFNDFSLDAASFAPNAPAILPVYINSGNLVISIATQSSRTYVLESAASLNPPVIWSTNAITTGTGGIITNTVSINPGQKSLFFRYLAQ